MAAALIYIYLQENQGGEIYTYTNTNGIKIISNTPILENYESKAQKPERRTLENENKAKQKQYENERKERGKLILLYSIFR
jgi:hypothetical protein